MNFLVSRNFFFVNFGFKNGCKNEFEDNNEKSFKRLKNRVPLEIDFRADSTHESIPTGWELIVEYQNSEKGSEFCFLNEIFRE